VERATWSRSLLVSSSARTWPFFTRSLMSTRTWATVPESSLPMSTLLVGCKVPLAVTLTDRFPRLATSVT
jgi:hypothetical protein